MLQDPEVTILPNASLRRTATVPWLPTLIGDKIVFTSGRKDKNFIAITPGSCIADLFAGQALLLCTCHQHDGSLRNAHIPIALIASAHFNFQHPAFGDAIADHIRVPEISLQSLGLSNHIRHQNN